MFNSNLSSIKKLLAKAALFFLPVIIVAYPLDIFLSKKQKQNVGFEISTWNELYAGTVNSGIVIYGSSRAWQTIDPTMMGDSLHTTAYNLGIDGHNFTMQYLRHRLLLKYNKKPKVIINSLDFVTLSKRPDLFDDDQFLPYMLWNTEIRNTISTYKGFNCLDYYVPLSRYYSRGQLIYHFLSTQESPRIRGYAGVPFPWDNSMYEHNQQVKFDTGTLQLFDNYLAECRKLNIKVIFVYPPEYVWGRNTILNRGEPLAYFSRYAKKYNIPFFDYSNDSLSYQKKYFWNIEHLNAKGSEIFTRELIDTLKKTHVLDGIITPVNH